MKDENSLNGKASGQANPEDMMTNFGGSNPVSRAKKYLKNNSKISGKTL